VMAKAYPQFGHNYNQVSRELMYNWFNKHLKLGQPEPVVERPFVPVPPKELSVFDEQHPLPKDAVDAKGLRNYLTTASDKQLAALLPKDTQGLAQFRHIFGTALRVMVGGALPATGEVEERREPSVKEADGVRQRTLALGRKGTGEAVPAV